MTINYTNVATPLFKLHSITSTGRERNQSTSSSQWLKIKSQVKYRLSTAPKERKEKKNTQEN